jgi:hypothetical protein
MIALLLALLATLSGHAAVSANAVHVVRDSAALVHPKPIPTPATNHPLAG